MWKFKERQGEGENIRREIIIFWNCIIKNHILSEKYIWFFLGLSFLMKSVCDTQMLCLTFTLNGKDSAMHFSSFSSVELNKQQRGFSYSIYNFCVITMATSAWSLHRIVKCRSSFWSEHPLAEVKDYLC